ncbi:hypothetical protein [Romboutsia sp.]|uniref:hypothetical protein n=1 Tax=Romboutsia sp. TaxID=1965302 RepID=UPI002C34EB76|nr:hypothetical protein [Romboutsia sp.]HSQ89848.1 hypothetical protein [Romboutsia sp.]
MAKKRKLKKGMALILGIILFFVVYFITFNRVRNLDEKNKEPVKTEEQEEDTRPLINQIKLKEKIYISDSKVENIRIEESYWSNVKVLFSEFTKIRKPESYTPVYNGYSDDGIRFSTDLNYFRAYTVSKEEYYKVPVATKNEFERLLRESIYLSFDFIKQYKSWETVEISYKGQTKKIHKWKFDDLSYKMASKRIVGKVQPEKNKERSKYNFTISIRGKYYNSTIETMGKDYVKMSAGEGKNKAKAYYEVHTGLYEYLVSEVFELEQSEK